MNLPRVIQVIESETRRGCGHSDSAPCPLNHLHEPMRMVRQYHTVDGEFLAEKDPWNPADGMGTDGGWAAVRVKAMQVQAEMKGADHGGGGGG